MDDSGRAPVVLTVPSLTEQSLTGQSVRRSVLVVDGRPLARRGLTLLLRAEPGLAVVGEVGGAEAVAAAARLRPDVVVMGTAGPGGDGVVAAARRIVAGEAGGARRVLVLTRVESDEEVGAALRAGASGYVLEDAAPDELVLAVRAVAAGDGWLPPRLTRHVLAEMARRPAAARPVGLDRLTPREVEVLGLVAHGLTNRQLMERLVVSEATVKTHVNRLLLKLGCGTRAQLVATAFHAGVVEPGADLPAGGQS